MIVLTLINGIVAKFRFKEKDLFFYWLMYDMSGEYKYIHNDRHVKINTDDGQLVITASMIKKCELINESY
jgi:hypothetical protein